MLNTGKGPAVHSLRAQADKKQYQRRMLHALQHQERLTLRQGEVEAIETAGGPGLRRADHHRRALPLRGGHRRHGRVPQEPRHRGRGARGFRPLGPGQRQGPLRRAGAARLPAAPVQDRPPARIDCRTVDFSKFEEQPGDERIVPFSFLTDRLEKEQISCYLGYTTPETHRIIRENLHRAPLFSGEIHGVGPRYCPSIEDKVVRFADRERHPLFLEPEGLDTLEWYVQGMSSSLPEDVQWAVYRSIPGLERVQLTRLAYAIEYDCIDPTQLRPTLEAKGVENLYFAGQINGSSATRRAAAQGLYAGINAAASSAGGCRCCSPARTPTSACSWTT